METRVHLLVCLVKDIQLASVVIYKLMLFLERNMKALKEIVRKQASPKGCMNEGYIVN
jgi:hypothetical protein